MDGWNINKGWMKLRSKLLRKKDKKKKKRERWKKRESNLKRNRIKELKKIR